jgi:hypothetical protein
MTEVQLSLGDRDSAGKSAATVVGQHAIPGVAVSEFIELRWITVQTNPRHYPF